MDENIISDRILEDYKYHRGLVGEAFDAASYMYERNRWSKYWFNLMISAQSNEDLWRYMIIFTKIVDYRYYCWKLASKEKNALYLKFCHSFKNDIKRRCKKWSDKREEKLFGNTPPHAIYLRQLTGVNRTVKLSQMTE